MISISLRKRFKPKLNFILKLINYKRIDPEYKNLKYKKILSYLKKMDTSKFDIALYKDNKILETGTSNLLFIKKNKIYSPNKNFYSGTTLKFFKKKIKKDIPYTVSKNIKNAVNNIFKDLKFDSNTKETILLSPAAASFDQFNNFESRGDHFKSLVMKKFKRKLNV